METQNERAVLVTFANPRGTNSLRLGEEDRAITESIRLAKHRDRIPLSKCHATTIHDLSRALLDDEFHIVQISGHGTRSGLVFEDTQGSRFVVPQSALADALAAYAAPKGSIECVILNSCYSLTTGTLASLGVPFTIAMEGAISDAAAIEFSRGFYDAIGAGKEIDFAYDEGCRRVRLAAPGTKFVSRLLRAGEIHTGTSFGSKPDQSVRGDSEAEETAPLLVGLGVDLSWSMQGNMQNDSGGAVSRLEGFRSSLYRTVKKANDRVRARVGEADATFDLFAYGFGLRHESIEYADLFSLIRVSRDVLTPNEIERIKAEHAAIVRSQYESKASQYRGLGDLASRYLGSGFVDSIVENAKSSAEQEVRQRVMSDIANRVASHLEDLGDTTLTLNELTDLWESSESAFENATELIFGRTPMCAVLRAIDRRFESELNQGPKETTASLFLLSDGEPTDGSPDAAIASIRDRGVAIVSCFVTDEDVADPRTLYGEPQSGWSDGARMMFDAASRIDDSSDWVPFLLRKGWTIHPDARLFVQINHTDVLDEFIDVVVLPACQSNLDWQLPAGEDPVNP